MPLEIREITISVEVNPDRQSTQATEQNGQLSEEVVQQIVDQVLAIVKAQKER